MPGNIPTKQTLYLIAKKRPLPVYMLEIKGEIFIDIDNPMWEAYVMNWKRKHGLLDKEKIKFKKLIDCTVSSIREIFNPDQNELNKLLNLINEKYGENG